MQATYDGKIFGQDNHFTIGTSIDHSKISFNAASELGYIYPDFWVGPNPPIVPGGQIIHTDSYIGYAPVDLSAKNTYYGVFASNTYDATDRLSLTAGARYNLGIPDEPFCERAGFTWERSHSFRLGAGSLDDRPPLFCLRLVKGA